MHSILIKIALCPHRQDPDRCLICWAEWNVEIEKLRSKSRLSRKEFLQLVRNFIEKQERKGFLKKIYQALAEELAGMDKNEAIHTLRNLACWVLFELRQRGEEEILLDIDGQKKKKTDEIALE